MAKKLTVSLIIPCYNEERTIKGCLEHVAAQNSSPDEVILVDNNCTDDTVKIAKQFPFVTVIREKKQGLIPARNKGFEYAKGDILARIDADTRIGPEWAKTIRSAFVDKKVHGVSGPAKAIVEIHLPFIRSYFWSKVYFKYIQTQYGLDVLWGPNMAIRSSVYNKIKNKLSTDSNEVHEDQDLSIIMHGHGYNIKILDKLDASVDGSRVADARKVLEYNNRRKRTFKKHYAKRNIQKKKLNIKDKAVLVLLSPFALWLFIQGAIYNVESWLGFRSD